jgi:hypothetical protein
MQAPEKRRDDRQLCAGLVELHWTRVDGPAVTIGNLDDLSPGGVSLLLECPLPQGTQVRFAYSGQSVSGEVRHCTPTELGWIAGVQFGPDSQWNPKAYPPEHLLDPKSIPKNARMRKGVLFAKKVRSPLSCLALGEAVHREQE